jgi:hypothetical protein
MIFETKKEKSTLCSFCSDSFYKTQDKLQKDDEIDVLSDPTNIFQRAKNKLEGKKDIKQKSNQFKYTKLQNPILFQHKPSIISCNDFITRTMNQHEEQKQKEFKEIENIRKVLKTQNIKAYNNLHQYNPYENDRLFLSTIQTDLLNISKKLPPIQKPGHSYKPSFTETYKKKTLSKLSKPLRHNNCKPIDLINEIKHIDNYKTINETNRYFSRSPHNMKFKIMKRFPCYGEVNAYY